jgi:hypothetical protein
LASISAISTRRAYRSTGLSGRCLQVSTILFDLLVGEVVLSLALLVILGRVVKQDVGGWTACACRRAAMSPASSGDPARNVFLVKLTFLIGR